MGNMDEAGQCGVAYLMQQLGSVPSGVDQSVCNRCNEWYGPAMEQAEQGKQYDDCPVGFAVPLGRQVSLEQRQKDTQALDICRSRKTLRRDTLKANLAKAEAKSAAE